MVIAVVGGGRQRDNRNDKRNRGNGEKEETARRRGRMARWIIATVGE